MIIEGLDNGDQTVWNVDIEWRAGSSDVLNNLYILQAVCIPELPKHIRQAYNVEIISCPQRSQLIPAQGQYTSIKFSSPKQERSASVICCVQHTAGRNSSVNVSVVFEYLQYVD